MNVAVFACADEPAIRHEGDDVVGIRGLCREPMLLVDAVGEATRAVLLLHERAHDLADVQKALRTAELDPLGVQILEVSAGVDEVELDVAVAGLQHRAEGFAGSRPEHAKPVLRGEVTRRGLFRPPNPVYLVAPMIDQKACAAADGCRACVDVCPQDAYKWHQGRIHFNKDVCEPCGRCVSACPTEAISNPAASPTMLAAQIDAIVEAGEAAIGIRFVCSRSTQLATATGWFDVEVPCTGMVPGGWLVSTLLIGAGSVSVLPCSIGGCPLGLDQHSREAVDFARAALASAGLEPESAPIDSANAEPKEPVAARSLQHPFTRAGDIQTMLALDSFSEEAFSVVHPGSSVGVVTIDPETCTLCTQCAQTCPTHAITAAYEGNRVSLTFDASSCTNCNQCTIACPEIRRGAISVTGRADAELLRSGRRTVHEGVVAVCEICGNAIAPTSMMARIGELLGEDFDDTMPYLSHRCMDCRGLT
ncbi:MAG: 4Fe-4S binding protein [Actinomycetota bacterium]|nr:4Fe-4S binding protein [Actinomycetota bacterium]